MREADFAPFCALLDDVWGLKGQTLSGGQKAIFFKALACHPIEAVRAGLDAHVKDPERGRFLPMPADVIAQIIGSLADDGRPGPEEAWATAVRGTDEAVTIVWTAETAAAWSIAKPVFDLGDEIGARMAFKEAYARLVAESRAIRLAPQWTPSLGHDAARRQLALTEAVNAGLLSAPTVAGLLPPPEVTAATLAPAVREKLLAVKARLLERPEAQSPDAAAKQATEAAKADVARRVDEYQRGQS